MENNSSSYAKCSCQHCSGHIEFDASAISNGRTEVECPHCGLQTILFVPARNSVAPRKEIPTPIIVTFAVVGALMMLAFGFRPVLKEIRELANWTENDTARQTSSPGSINSQIDRLPAKPFLMSSEEKMARENILKAFLDISSATALGVSRVRYSDLLTKALSTLRFEQTKLSEERHFKYLQCAERALYYYAQAEDRWSAYFEYEWMREQEEALMSQANFDELRQSGITVNPSEYRQYKDGFYYVPFQTCLSLYWGAANVYIKKMTEDSAR